MTLLSSKGISSWSFRVRKVKQLVMSASFCAPTTLISALSPASLYRVVDLT